MRKNQVDISKLKVESGIPVPEIASRPLTRMEQWKRLARKMKVGSSVAVANVTDACVLHMTLTKMYGKRRAVMRTDPKTKIVRVFRVKKF